MIKMKSTPTYQHRKWKNCYTFALKIHISPWIVKHMYTFMVSILDPTLANMFMVELEQNIISTLSKDISLWKRYVDDTICFVNSNRISHVLESLNSFHSNIKFTVEIEKGNKIAFLDILLIRYKDLINTTVYRKKTNTDLYINWNFLSPNSW